jgi:hypothetical protein
VLLICHPLLLFRLAIAWAEDAEWELPDADAPGRCRVDMHGARVVLRRGQQPVYTMDAAGHVNAWDWDDVSVTPSKAVASPCVCSALSCATSVGCRKYLVVLSHGRHGRHNAADADGTAMTALQSFVLVATCIFFFWFLV